MYILKNNYILEIKTNEDPGYKAVLLDINVVKFMGYLGLFLVQICEMQTFGDIALSLKKGCQKTANLL